MDPNEIRRVSNGWGRHDYVVAGFLAYVKASCDPIASGKANPEYIEEHRMQFLSSLALEADTEQSFSATD